MLTGTFWASRLFLTSGGGSIARAAKAFELRICGKQPARTPLRSLSSAGRIIGLEEVADRELEVAVLLVRQRREREAPLEAERAERREPADAEAGRRCGA
jgi:hypothetical protein